MVLHGAVLCDADRPAGGAGEQHRQAVQAVPGRIQHGEERAQGCVTETNAAAASIGTAMTGDAGMIKASIS